MGSIQRVVRAARNPRRSWTRFRKLYLHGAYLDVGAGPRNSVFLAGSGRSGTTWISQVINYDNHYRYVFEPFHPDRGLLPPGFVTRQYLRPEDPSPFHREVVGRILSGRVRSAWTDRHNRRVVGSERLVKDIWTNLLLGWIHRQFPEVPIVLMLRHPCAVVASQLALADWGWHAEPKELLAQSELVEDHLEPFLPAIDDAETPFERSVVTWCIENYVPLRQFRPGEIHLAFYEDFCMRPGEEARRLFRFLGRVPDRRILPVLRQPTFGVRRDSAIVAGEHLVESWRKRVTSEDVDRAQRILSAFGLDRIYAEGSMPKARPEAALAAA